MSHGGDSPFGVRHLEAFFGWLHKYGVNTGIIAAVMGIGLIIYFFIALDVGTNRIISLMIATSPLWLPYLLFYLWYESWMFYIQNLNRYKAGRVSLEILIPKDVFKSPVAMEHILTQLFQKASPDNLLDTYWAGKHPPWWGFEVISTEGAVRLIVNSQNNKYKLFVETAFYSQYPGIELRELPVDYTAAVPWDPEHWGYMPIHFGKKKTEAGEMAYPIMTYIDFGLDKDPKEEYKHSPMAAMLELLGSLGPGEHLWFQFLARVHREETFDTGSISGTVPDWRAGIKKEIKKIFDDARKRSASEDDESKGSVMLTPMERSNVEALERAISKWPFKVHIRVFYAAKLENINYDRIGQAITVFQATEHHSRNGIRYKWRADYDWNWWQDPTGRKRLHHKMEELEQYKLRLYEGKNHRDVGSIMTTEEIATLFHIPSSVVTTPGLSRIPSARAEAPSNLPTG
jgi:hypothetical protein